MHLYVHVPFCARRCSYCDFSIAVRKQVPAREFVECVQRELDLRRGEMPARRLDTLYLGGGTPSRLPPDAVTSLLDAFRSTFLLDSAGVDAVEVTLEANPEDVTPANAKAWRAAGINRISLGAQSFDDGVLAWMHRGHDGARIEGAVRALAAAGFDNVSLDLIFALPAELGRDWSRDLDRVLALHPAHLSLYGLTVEPRTPLARWINRGASAPPDDDRYAEEYLLAHERLSAAGYRFYEVSNASRDGFHSRHNSAYWSGHAYVGIGPAAHSYDGTTRRWNLAQWVAYRRAIHAGRSPVESAETLTPEQRELERVYLAMRTDQGLALTAPDRPLPPHTAWLDRGWVRERNGRLVCTPEGWLRLDWLVRDLTGSVAIT